MNFVEILVIGVTNISLGDFFRKENFCMSVKGASMPSEKSVIVAYIFWIFGGIFGLHHFYLRRDRHAFVWWSTLGGFGIGWLGEVFRIPRYVRDANEDPTYMQELVKRMLQNKKVRLLILQMHKLT